MNFKSFGEILRHFFQILATPQEYLFCKCFIADLMTQPTKYKRLIAKNGFRNVSLKQQMANLRRSTIFSPEASQTNFNQILAITIQYKPTQHNPRLMENLNSPPGTSSWSESAFVKWKNRDVCCFQYCLQFISRLLRKNHRQEFCKTTFLHLSSKSLKSTSEETHVWTASLLKSHRWFLTILTTNRGV